MILRGCTPRKEVLHGDLDDAIFAADFGSLIAGDRCPKVYREPAAFFENTHPAAQLKKVVEVVFGRLADANEAGTMVRLSTGFEGGKTHTLMSLWHLAKNIKDHKLGTDLLPGAVPVAGKSVVPQVDQREEARKRLASLRGTAPVGNIMSPSGEERDAVNR